MKRVMATATSKPPLFCRPCAISHTRTGAPTTPSTQVTSSAHSSTVATASISACVTSSPSRARLSASKGTKACENAPSANSRRSRLGMRKATLKASVITLAPKAAATICSRTSPVMRDASVSRETVDAARSRFMEGMGWPIAGRERGRRARWVREYRSAY